MHYKIFLFFITVFFAIKTPADNKISIAALVNDKVITTNDLNNRVRLVLLGAPRQPTEEELKAVQQKVLLQMIDETLQVQEAKMFDIKADAEEIKRHLEQVEKQNNMAPGELQKKLKEANIPWGTFLDQTEAGIAWAKFLMQLRHFSKVGKQDIKTHAHQQQNRDQTRYLLAEIVLPFESKGEELQAEQVAQQALQEIQMGKPFSQVALEISQVPSAARGGDIDWVDEDQLIPAEANVITKMPVGSLSQPIDIGGAYKILLLRGKHDKHKSHQKLKVRQLDITLPLMMTTEQKEEEVKKWAFMMQGIHDCPAFEAMADKIEGATLQIHEDISPDQLSGGLDQILEQLPLNHVSEPLPVEDKKVFFFMVCERHEISKEDFMAEKKDTVEEELSNKKLESLAAQRMKNMHRRAYIDVRI